MGRQRRDKPEDEQASCLSITSTRNSHHLALKHTSMGKRLVACGKRNQQVLQTYNISCRGTTHISRDTQDTFTIFRREGMEEYIEQIAQRDDRKTSPQGGGVSRSVSVFLGRRISYRLSQQA